ncbi:MAG: hypothetical protein NWE92_04765 [Candidatus Bathyarchaeota archaeon]|nr:hypothetical protein [Candidatus Bathyarchaeota archaeon]
MDKNKSFALILSLLVLSASASTVRAVEVVKRVPIHCVPVMVYDSYKGAIWVAPDYFTGYWGVEGNLPSYSPTNTVVAISDNDSSVLANFTFALDPHPVAYDSTLHEVYVVVENTVSVISDESNSVIATIEPNTSIIDGPSRWVYDSGKGEMFTITHNQTYNYTSGYTNYTNGVTVISCITKQVVATIPLGDYPAHPAPQGLTYDSEKGEIYVSYVSYVEQSENYVSVISDSNNSVIATIPLGNITRHVGSGAYDSATGEIYLPMDNNTVLVISDKTHTVTDTIEIPRPKEHVGPFDIVYDPVKSVIFAAFPDGAFIISTRTKSVIETSPIGSVESIVYDSGQNLIVFMYFDGIDFISLASLPDPPPTPTPTPTATPTPSLQNPVFLDLDWVQIAILVAMGIIAVAAGVAAFRFLRKDTAQKQTEQE